MNKFMKEAVEEAEKGIRNSEGGPFGCVIVKDGKIIGRGHNQVLLKKDPTCHGEINAIRDACSQTETHDLSGCELYTTGEPCPMCMGAVMWANIDRVYYGCTIQDTDRIGFRDEVFYNKNKEEMLICTDRDECLKLYAEYESISDRKLY